MPVTSVNPSVDVLGDYNTPYSKAGQGITAALHDELAALAQKWSIGIYDLNAGHGGPSTDPHEQGNAADIDALNGRLFSYDTVTPDEIAFAQDALQNPNVKVGTYQKLQLALQKADPADAARIVEDEGNGAHIHLQIAGAANMDPLGMDFMGLLPKSKAQADAQKATLADPLGVNRWWGTATADIQYWMTNIGLTMLAIAVMAGGLAIAAGKDNLERAGAAAAA